MPELFCPYELEPFEVVEELDSHQKFGLTTAQLKKRRRKYGQNLLRDELRITLGDGLKEQIKNPLTLFLFFSPFLLYAFDPDAIYFVLSGLTAIMAIANGFIEWQASKSMGMPRKYSSIKALVTRDGKTSYCDSRTLVPGDVIDIEENMVIPADCRLIDSDMLSVLETHVYGKDVAVAKDSTVIETRDESIVHENMVYAGSIVTSGRGRAIVCFTGKDTLVRKLQNRKENILPRLLRYVRSTTSALSLCAIVTVLLLIALGVFTGAQLQSTFILSIAIGCSFITDTTVSLCDAAFGKGLKALARDRAVIKNYNCISTLCDVNTVMCDKETIFPSTGMSVDELFIDNTFYSAGSAYKGRTLDLLKYALLCSNITINENDHRKSGRASFSGTLWDEAIAYAIDSREIDIAALTELYFRMDCDFGGLSQISRVMYLHNGKSLAIIKGPPEDVLSLCSGYTYKGQAFKLSELTRKKILQAVKEKSKGSAYMLGIATCESKAQNLQDPASTRRMLFMGFITFNSFMAVDTASAIYRLGSAGIETVVNSDGAYYSEISRATDAGIIKSEDEVCTDEIMHGDDIGLFIANCPDYKLFLGLTSEEWYQILTYRKQDGRHIATCARSTEELGLMKDSDVTFVSEDAPDVLRQSADVLTLGGGFKIMSDCLHGARSMFMRIHSLTEYSIVAATMLALLYIAQLILGLEALRLQDAMIVGLLLNFVFMCGMALSPSSRGDLLEKLPKYAQKPSVKDYGMPIFYALGGAIAAGAVWYLTTSSTALVIALTVLTYVYSAIGISRRGLFAKKSFGGTSYYIAGLIAAALIAAVILLPFFGFLAYESITLVQLGIALLLPILYIIITQALRLTISKIKK